jgi:hypothetical protein
VLIYTYFSLSKRLFSNTVIKLGSQATGLYSSTAQFTPANTPYHAIEGSSEIQYSAAGFLDAHATKSSDPSTALWELNRRMIEDWWFGDRTGATAQKVSKEVSRSSLTQANLFIIV